MKLVVTIEASEWTEDHADVFMDWLNDELNIGNMATGDDVVATDYKIVK
jgi:hypothetical protein